MVQLLQKHYEYTTFAILCFFWNLLGWVEWDGVISGSARRLVPGSNRSDLNATIDLIEAMGSEFGIW